MSALLSDVNRPTNINHMGSAVRTGGPAYLNNITVGWEFVGKELALKYLATHRRNRDTVQSTLTQYTSDLKDEIWEVTHQGIAFDADGHLIDGRHRLTAIANADVPVWLLVTRGLPEHVIEVIDRNRVRTLAHTLQIMGFNTNTKTMSYIARRMRAGVHNPPSPMWTDRNMQEFVNTHLAALLYATGCCPPRECPSGVGAAIARAYYTYPLDRLERFVQAMNDKILPAEQQPGDQSARALYKLWQATNISGKEVQTVFYRKAQRALYAYLKGEDLVTLRETREDLFPLPSK